jgi:hypothetical protein
LLFELLTKDYLGDQIKKNEMDGHVNPTGERRGAYRLLVGKPGRKRPRERPRHRWKDNTKMDLQEVGSRLWIGLTLLHIGSGVRVL